MSNNTSSDQKTRGITLRRTNYGEADRILNLITPAGKCAVIAKGVRKPHSKLAGGVEMFTLSDLQIHHSPKSHLGILTSAKMLTHYSNIIKDYKRLELAGFIMKRIDSASEHTDSSTWFDITSQSLASLNDLTTPIDLIEAWFLLHLLHASGEEINLYRDTSGAKLQAASFYEWNISEKAFTLAESSGSYGANEIKLLRLLTTVDLATIKRIKFDDSVLQKTLKIAHIVAGI